MKKKPGVAPHETLPPLYSGWLAGVLEGGIPREELATCDNCVMCGQSGKAAYDLDTKCCTYLPELPNFLVGRALLDPETLPDGKKSVRDRIKRGIGVTPFALRQPPVYEAIYARSPESFGRAKDLKCPHLVGDGKLCGIWKNRNSVCSTWFCMHVQGENGREFWIDRLKPTLKSVEKSLAIWCVHQLNPGTEAMQLLFKDFYPRGETDAYTGDAGKAWSREDVEGKANPELYKKRWGDWHGKEEEFYSECARLVSPLSWEQVLGICGPETRALAELAHDSHRALVSGELPERLRVGPFSVLEQTDEKARVQSPGYTVALDLPRSILGALHRFDGRPIRAVLKSIETQDDLELDLELVRKLWDYRILVAF